MARILVAEDDTAVKSFVSRALSHRGHKVTSVEDGVQALEALDRDSFDLLITDIVMPSLDGIGLALKVAKDFPCAAGAADDRLLGGAPARAQPRGTDLRGDHQAVHAPGNLRGRRGGADRRADDLPLTR
jgi:CheY-like chemotaxis protein